MQSILAPSSLFPVEEAESSDCDQQTCDKFNQQLVELRSGKDSAAEPAAPAKSRRRPSSSADAAGCCLSDVVIDCTCLDAKPKPTRLYYCCCINLRCSASACRSVLFVLAFGLISGGVAAAAGVTVWGVAVGRTEARNYGLAGFAGGLLLFVYACCVASQCQARRKTRELREQAALMQQQLAQEPQRLVPGSRLSSGNCLVGSSQPSLWPAEDSQQQPLQPQQKQPLQKQKSAAGKGGAAKGPKKKQQQQNAIKKAAGGDCVRLPPPAAATSEPVIFDLEKF